MQAPVFPPPRASASLDHFLRFSFSPWPLFCVPLPWASGIVDSANVVLNSLQNSASIAGLVLTTECVITTKVRPPVLKLKLKLRLKAERIAEISRWKNAVPSAPIESCLWFTRRIHTYVCLDRCLASQDPAAK